MTVKAHTNQFFKKMPSFRESARQASFLAKKSDTKTYGMYDFSLVQPFVERPTGLSDRVLQHPRVVVNGRFCCKVVAV